MTAHLLRLTLLTLLVVSILACGPAGGIEAEAPEPQASKPSATGPGASKPPRGARRARTPGEDVLTWLKRQQALDGGWQEGLAPGAQTSDDVRLTAIVLLAYHAACYTNRGRHPFAKTISKGLRFLKRRQAEDDVRAPESPVASAAAAAALTSAYAMTGSLIWRDAARQSLAGLAAQARDGGPAGVEAIGWTLVALRQARGANRNAFRHARTLPYSIPEEAFSRLATWSDVPPTADDRRRAVGALACLLFDPLPTGRTRLEAMGLALAARPLVWPPGAGTSDPVAAVLSARTLHFVPSRMTRAWRRASADIIRQQIPRLDDKETSAGSWDPDTLPGYDGGRIRLTALCAQLLCLLPLPYSQPRIEDVR